MAGPDEVAKTLASSYERLRKYDAKGLDGKAVAVCDKILKAEIDPSLLREVQKTKCVCLIRQQKLDAALTIAQKEGFKLEEAFVLYKQKDSQAALSLLDQLGPAENASPAAAHLRAQLNYRMGDYDEARAEYDDLVTRAGDGAMNELVANYIASSVLAGSSDGVMEALGRAANVGRDAGEAFELMYNKACALIAVGDSHGAADALASAISLGQAFLQTDERLTDANVAAELAILKVQRAFALQQGLTKLSAAAASPENEDLAAETMDLLHEALAANASDKAVSAVAANNLLALRGDHEVFDSFKRMRLHAADATNLDTLPQSSQQTIAVNRALLLLKMNKTRECRKLLADLRAASFADLASLDLIEAVLLEQDGKAGERDTFLDSQLEKALASNELDRAAKLALARAQTQISVGEIDAALGTLRDRPELRSQPSILNAALTLCQHAGRDEEADALLSDDSSLASTPSGGDRSAEVRVALLRAEVTARRGDPAGAVEIYDSILSGKFGPIDGDLRMEALANYVLAASRFDTEAAEAKAKALPMPAGIDEVDVETLEAGLLKAKARPRRVRSIAASSDAGPRSPAAEDAAKKMRSLENKRKKELKKRAKRREAHLAVLRERNGPDFDPAKEKVDPERWIPKNMRQAALKARKKRGAKLTGAQGGGAVGAKEAARLDARASATAPASSSKTSNKKRGKKGRR
ncbi:Signal recognition particle subunit SRP72 [Hondaea fermentalgiana]|uniref:Signal recognition particle subunit SRP72 n=1 Tax=Hondaea fermentalgiana TaxID=2315210 RepID=A0A2R5GMY5_9STRA|nr:Signal recognition particle subunit SRP72 [Hondaea fermentalgiana]|eukprot:GBG32262.1 Signal recognition particle subunit SRP72 [Hondaea fermentalgiana]